jgi:hypothetical protein
MQVRLHDLSGIGMAPEIRLRGGIAQIAKDPLDIEIIGRRIVALRSQQHAHVRAVGNQRSHQVRAKVTVCAGDEDLFARRCLGYWRWK